MQTPDNLMRERTQDIRLETTYCRHCKFNHWSNIGHLECVKCGNEKGKAQ